MGWTEHRVRALVSDDASWQAGNKLATAGPWSLTGSTDELVWGTCQGSGRTPYQVTIELAGPRYRCSCPSRKFPCKHVVALLLLMVRDQLKTGTPPDSARDWAEQTARRAATAPAKSTDEPVDPAAQERRLQQRIRQMDDGIAGFAVWLEDLVTHGLSTARRSGSFERTAARLVDAKLPGIAQSVRDAQLRLSEPDWPERLLSDVGSWWALVRRYQQRESLDEDEFADLRVAVGWPLGKEDVRGRGTRSTELEVVGATETLVGRIQEQRTWVWDRGEARYLVALDFAPTGGSVQPVGATGGLLRGEVASYPGRTVPRLLPVQLQPVGVISRFSAPAIGVAEMYAEHARYLVANPWHRVTPAVVSGQFSPPDSDGTGWLTDERGHAAALTHPDPWTLLALAADDQVSVFGEFNGSSFRPLSIALAGEVALL